MQKIDFLRREITSAKQPKIFGVQQASELMLGTVSMATRFSLLLMSNVVYAAVLLSMVPLFFGSKPLTFQEWQVVAQADVLHMTALKLGAILTFLQIVARRGI